MCRMPHPCPKPPPRTRTRHWKVMQNRPVSGKWAQGSKDIPVQTRIQHLKPTCKKSHLHLLGVSLLLATLLKNHILFPAFMALLTHRTPLKTLAAPQPASSRFTQAEPEVKSLLYYSSLALEIIAQSSKKTKQAASWLNE